MKAKKIIYYCDGPKCDERAEAPTGRPEDVHPSIPDSWYSLYGLLTYKGKALIQAAPGSDATALHFHSPNCLVKYIHDRALSLQPAEVPRDATSAAGRNTCGMCGGSSNELCDNHVAAEEATWD